MSGFQRHISTTELVPLHVPRAVMHNQTFATQSTAAVLVQHFGILVQVQDLSQ